jgi:uncharacterized protein YbaP (TraB family)
MRMSTPVRGLAAGALLLLASGLATAQDNCPPPAPTLEALRPEQLQSDVRDRGFLWKLSRDGRTSWLYGTVHVARPEWMLPGPAVQAALEASPVLALELDPSDPELANVFATPEDPARKQRVMAGLGPQLAKAVARECVSAASIASMQPLLQVTMLSLYETRRDGFHPEFAVDAMLWGMARLAGKQVVALETPASQVAALIPESEADERVLVTQGLEEIDSGEGRSTLLRLLKAWAEGDAQTLASYPQWCQCLDTPAERRYLERLNDERNGPMADKLSQLHASGQDFFAAVGSLHMTGPHGLDKLLRARGFQVERVSFPSSQARP